MSESPATIYLADDHQIVIDGLKLLIDSEVSLKIIGSANDGTVAYKEILNKKPDVTLIDHRMPGMTGIEIIKTLKKQVKTKFIVLSMHDDKHLIADAMNYGAVAYLLKNTGKTELIECIHKVIKGETVFPTVLTNKVYEKPSTFTPRELEILRMIINEFTTQQISKELYLSPYTVDTHRKNICRKAKTKTIIGLLNYIKENAIEL